jgi:hypothetical protein
MFRCLQKDKGVRIIVFKPFKDMKKEGKENLENFILAPG